MACTVEGEYHRSRVAARLFRVGGGWRTGGHGELGGGAVEVDGGGGDPIQGTVRGASDRATLTSIHAWVVVMRGELIEALDQASSEAAAEGFTHMARQLDECGLAFAHGVAEKRCDERELAERARKCLEMWRALREW